MTAEFESMVGMLLIVMSITCIVQVIFVGLLLWYVKRMADSLAGASPAAAPGVPVPVAGPHVPPRPSQEQEAEAVPAPVAPPVTPPVTPPVELLTESPDIQESIRRLAQKYSLSDFIITTMDGLVVVSLRPGSSEEAARFSDTYRRRKKPASPGVSFLEITHRGEPMLAIAGSDRPLDPDRLQGIEEDARKILDWWL
jgi:hypothetical protein